MRQLSQSLAANLAVLDKMFGTSADYYAKEITIYHCRGSILLFDGMASLDSLWELLLDEASSFGGRGPAASHRRSRQASVAPGRRSLS